MQDYYETDYAFKHRNFFEVISISQAPTDLSPHATFIYIILNPKSSYSLLSLSAKITLIIPRYIVLFVLLRVENSSSQRMTGIGRIVTSLMLIYDV